MRVDKSAVFCAYFIAVSIFLSIKGNALAYYDATLIGKVLYINKIKAVELKCQSTKKPFQQHVEFFVDYRTVDYVQLESGKCYSSEGQCSYNRCVCSKDGKAFIWIFYPDDHLRSYVFGCEIRTFDQRNNTVRTTVFLGFDGSDFSKETTINEIIAINPDAITNSNPRDSNSNVIPYVAGVTVVVVGVLTILTVFAIVMFNIRKRRREYPIAQIEAVQAIRYENAQIGAVQVIRSENAQNQNKDEMVENLETSNKGCSDESSKYVTKKLVENTNPFIDLEFKFEENHDNTSSKAV